jgi:hypothetical protein
MPGVRISPGSATFAAYLKSFSGEASGDKRTGYTLTPRSLTNATELLKVILQPDEGSLPRRGNTSIPAAAR